MNGWGGNSFSLAKAGAASILGSGVVAGGLPDTELLGAAPTNVAIPMPDSTSPDGILPSTDPGKGWWGQTSALRYGRGHPSSTTSPYWGPPLPPPERSFHSHMGTIPPNRPHTQPVAGLSRMWAIGGIVVPSNMWDWWEPL